MLRIDCENITKAARYFFRFRTNPEDSTATGGGTTQRDTFFIPHFAQSESIAFSLFILSRFFQQKAALLSVSRAAFCNGFRRSDSI
jgi:hypothetical protein